MIDGVWDTSWSSTHHTPDRDPGNWLQLDLGQERTMTRFVLKMRSDSPTEASRARYIEVSLLHKSAPKGLYIYWPFPSGLQGPP